MICSVHFSEEDLEVGLMNRALNMKEIHRLKSGSVPSVSLPLQIERKSDNNRNNRVNVRHEKQKIRGKSILYNNRLFGIILKYLT
jgi:hypothetical protein